ncbi:unnamed protein product [Lota lota]
MHSVAVDRNGSPSKRTLSRGMSEDESLRIIITETETPARRFARSDSRGGTLKRRSGSQQCDPEIFKILPDVMELQAGYEEVVQELRGLEVEREALLFQVDVLQDSLESVEELLAEAQREAGQARTEAEQERMTKRKLEDEVRALLSEVERLNEERNTLSTLQAHSLPMQEAKAYSTQAPSTLDQAPSTLDQAPSTLDQAPSTLDQAPSTLDQAPSTLDQAPSTLDQAPSSPQAWGATAAESGQGPSKGTRAGPFQNLANIPLVQFSTLALNEPFSLEGVLGRPCGRRSEGEGADRNNDTDSISAYEDASADTPELDHAFPGPGGDDLDGDEEEEEPQDGTDPGKRNLDQSCLLS